MIADTIKELRESRNWTQSELARKLGVTRSGVNAWEQGISIPAINSVIQLSKLFSVPADYLLGLSDIKSVSVEGLSTKDIALVTALIDRLKKNSDNQTS